ncbi:dnaJ subfamily B member 6-like isoform X1 [Carex littledalei]|uniref:DnaJ subfamily B member 6-like isoform X1 n=1 Tax=Carex littledalei TaxID=544730 RepID=A0A833VI98_9POAL|nr:dnaJ subfamily B member 6-like isoform X1 [Carex littledalei]
MAGERTGDLYTILGVNKDCSSEELRFAYKRLAMRWHPDKCSSSSNSICMEQANQKFQKIQGAYSVLSDSNKRFLYDVGVYDSDDEDSNTGLTEILDEVFEMMNQTKSSENGPESLDELQRLFEDIFSSDGNSGSGASKVEKRFNGWDGSTSSHSAVSRSGPNLVKPERLGPDPSEFSGVS